MKLERLAVMAAMSAIMAATPVFAQPGGARSANATTAPAANVQRYLMQYRSGNGDALKQAIALNGGTVALDYSSLFNGLAADMTPDGMRAVRAAGLATTIEEDAMRTLHALPGGFPVAFPEFVGWGVDRAQGDAVWSMAPNNGVADNGVAGPDVEPGSVTGAGIVVAVLDTGIDFNHPDLAGNIVDNRGSGVVRDFIGNDDDATDAALIGHGTSVASTIASADNGEGVIGVAPESKVSPYRVCGVGGCPLSAIIGGLVQATADGVDVINMSFGGSAGFNIESSAVQAANMAGVVLVASAGNDGSQQPSFPAAYDTVIAVGATDINDNPAVFTNVGGWVDVTGPGVDIPLATCLGCGRAAFVNETTPTARSFQANGMTGTPLASVLNTEVVNVGRACTSTLGDVLAANPAGKVALIIRGSCSFAEKVAAAEAAGAVATIVYNNVAGNFFGTLGAYAASGPSVSIANADGVSLAGEIATSGPVSVDVAAVATDYEFISGTSFSGPLTAGIAALVLSVDPSLSPIEVRKIIEKTAEPLGANVIFANGMVRADRAVAAAQN